MSLCFSTTIELELENPSFWRAHNIYELQHRNKMAEWLHWISPWLANKPSSQVELGLGIKNQGLLISFPCRAGALRGPKEITDTDATAKAI